MAATTLSPVCSADSHTSIRNEKLGSGKKLLDAHGGNAVTNICVLVSDLVADEMDYVPILSYALDPTEFLEDGSGEAQQPVSPRLVFTHRFTVSLR